MSDPSTLKTDLKVMLVRDLNLAGREPESIGDEEPLFGEGLGLDSLDALQIAMSIEEQFGVRIPDDEEARAVFRSVSALAEFVLQSRASGRP